ncbi:hypothetical protein COO60DRAFT_1643772 [Scenedesmus sp. NREL 46B-D3]|nr:hypothetical protein COO60DRAFT_1643772 [Scenedesmus sp. NREL 46B-D3]
MTTPTVHSAVLLARLNDLAQDFAGERVIEASILQQSWIAPHIFKGMAKQPRQAAVDRLPSSAYYMVHWNKKQKTFMEGTDATPADKCLIKLEQLATDPCLVDPVMSPPKGRISSWLSDWINKWRTPLSHSEEGTREPGTDAAIICAKTHAEPAPSHEHALLLQQKAEALAIPFAGTQVIEAGELCKSGVIPDLFKKLTKTPRKAVYQRLVYDQDYLVARKDKHTDRYVSCEPSVAQAKFLVKLEYITQRLSAGASSQPDGNDAQQESTTAMHSAQASIPVIPYLEELDLEEQEMFKDSHGMACRLTCRGERHPRRCFFKVTDVGRMLGVTDMTTNLRGPTSAFLPEEDYVKMREGEDETAVAGEDEEGGRCGDPGRLLMDAAPQQQGERVHYGQTELYLTYRGLLRCLFCSRKPVARTFVTWVEEVLFAAHLGTTQQREELAAALVGLDVDIVRQFARHVLAFKMAGVYLLLIGSVADLRQSMGLSADLPGDSLVCKWGRTEDMDARLAQHMKQYGALEGANLKLVYFAAIDPRYQSKAEMDAKTSVCEVGVRLTGVVLGGQVKTELVVFTSRELKVNAKHVYERIAIQFAGCLKEMAEELSRNRAVGEERDKRLEDKDERLKDKDERLKAMDKRLEDKDEINQMLRDKVKALERELQLTSAARLQ